MMLTFSKIRYLQRFGSTLIPSSAGRLRPIEPSFLVKSVSTTRIYRKTELERRRKHQPVATANIENDDDTFGTIGGNGDTFGSIGGDEEAVVPLKAEALPDDDDGYDELFINRDRKHILHYKYTLMSLIHPQDRKAKPRIVEALKLFDEMKRVDRKQIRPFIYTMLISGAAENGYTEKAFELFQEAMKHKLKPTPATYTSLFNSCAECPFKEMGLEKARWLRGWMQEVAIVPNQSHYHAMIKAFGKLGDLNTAYEVVDEMFSKEIAIDTSTFNHLLVACISQPENGFGEAIKLYRRMRFHRVPRDLTTYKLLLRATQYCGIGDKDKFKKLLHQWLNMEKTMYYEKTLSPKTVKTKKRFERPQISYSSDRLFELQADGSVKYLTEGDDKEIESTSISTGKDLIKHGKSNQQLMEKPNFLISSKFSKMGQVIDIDFDSLKYPNDRFGLIGGLEGILHLLENDKLKPDIATYTMILYMIPFDKESENHLISCLSRTGVKPDTGFYNQIIKRRSSRRDLTGVKEILREMAENSVPFDLATFGVLAVGCRNVRESSLLLQDLEKAGFKPSIQIMGALIQQACRNRDIDNMRYLIEKMEKYNLEANRRVIDMLTIAVEEIGFKLWSIEKGKAEAIGRLKDPEYAKKFDQFKRFFEKWVKRIPFEFDQHPWDQFKYDRGDWGYHKMHQYEKTMKEKILNREDARLAAKEGQKVNPYKMIHSVFTDE